MRKRDIVGYFVGLLLLILLALADLGDNWIKP